MPISRFLSFSKPDCIVLKKEGNRKVLTFIKKVGMEKDDEFILDLREWKRIDKKLRIRCAIWYYKNLKSDKYKAIITLKDNTLFRIINLNNFEDYMEFNKEMREMTFDGKKFIWKNMEEPIIDNKNEEEERMELDFDRNKKYRFEVHK